MNILILGATGTFGTVLTEKLLKNTDDKITLFARHASEKYSTTEHTAVIDGDALKSEDLKNAIKNQDVVYCAISGGDLPKVAENIVAAMAEFGVKRLIFMGAVGIYNEIPEDIDPEDNVDNNPEQVPNRQAVDVVEASALNYTILRPGYLQDGDENDYTLTIKGQAAKGYITTIPSIVNLAAQIIYDSSLYSRESLSITKDMQKGLSENTKLG